MKRKHKVSTIKYEFGKLPKCITGKTNHMPSKNRTYTSKLWLRFIEHAIKIVNRTGKPNIPIYCVDRMKIEYYMPMRRRSTVMGNTETVIQMLVEVGVLAHNSWTTAPRVEIVSTFRRNDAGTTVKLFVDERHPGNRGLNLSKCNAVIA